MAAVGESLGAGRGSTWLGFIGGFGRSISVELAAEVGVSPEEAALFAECNRELIADRFANGIARSSVVAELHELSIAAGMILAA